MTARERILSNVKKNAPASFSLEEVQVRHTAYDNPVEKFKNTLVSIGGAVLEVRSFMEVEEFISAKFGTGKVIKHLPSITGETFSSAQGSHALADVKVAVLEGKFGVAENGATWLTDFEMGDRALPFICENLILIIQPQNVVSNMDDAYKIMGNADYNFGAFIAGPSKTADIEQSLVLGAHGPKTLTVFLLKAL